MASVQESLQSSQASSDGGQPRNLIKLFMESRQPNQLQQQQHQVLQQQQQQAATSTKTLFSPTKPKAPPSLRPRGRTATRPKSLNDFESFNHIKDWDSLNVLLPSEFKGVRELFQDQTIEEEELQHYQQQENRMKPQPEEEEGQHDDEVPRPAPDGVKLRYARGRMARELSVDSAVPDKHHSIATGGGHSSGFGGSSNGCGCGSNFGLGGNFSRRNKRFSLQEPFGANVDFSANRSSFSSENTQNTNTAQRRYGLNMPRSETMPVYHQMMCHQWPQHPQMHYHQQQHHHQNNQHHQHGQLPNHGGYPGQPPSHAHPQQQAPMCWHHRCCHHHPTMCCHSPCSYSPSSASIARHNSVPSRRDPDIDQLCELLSMDDTLSEVTNLLNETSHFKSPTQAKDVAAAFHDSNFRTLKQHWEALAESLEQKSSSQATPTQSSVASTITPRNGGGGPILLKKPMPVSAMMDHRRLMSQCETKMRQNKPLIPVKPSGFVSSRPPSSTAADQGNESRASNGRPLSSVTNSHNFKSMIPVPKGTSKPNPTTANPTAGTTNSTNQQPVTNKNSTGLWWDSFEEGI